MTQETDEEVDVKEDFFLNLEDQSRFVALLKTAGIVRAVIDYDGGGDSGQVNDSAIFFDVNNKRVEPPKGKVRILADEESDPDDNGCIEVDLHQAMQSMCYRALHMLEYDWINNDGGYGEFVIDFTTSPYNITLQHNQRISDTEYHEMDW